MLLYILSRPMCNADVFLIIIIQTIIFNNFDVAMSTITVECLRHWYLIVVRAATIVLVL